MKSPVGVLTSVALAVLVIVPLAMIDGAIAATPLPSIPYSGDSAHGHFTVNLTADCKQGGSNCAHPSVLAVSVDTHPPKHSKCPTNSNFVFDQMKVHKDGSFKGSDYFTTTFQLKINGRWTSARQVKGMISGNSGCGGEKFSIKIHPVSTKSPCELLDAVHAGKILAPGTKERTDTDTFSLTGGQCSKTLGPQHGMGLDIAASRDALTPTGTATPLKGPGKGATYYYYRPYFPYTTMYVVFHRSKAWASTSFRITQKGSCSAPDGCPLPKSELSKAKRHLIKVATKLYGQLK